MSEGTIVVASIIMAFSLIVMEILVLYLDFKTKFLNTSYSSLKFICDSICTIDTDLSVEYLAEELNRFYNEYAQETPKFRKTYPNVVLWLDAILFRIDYGSRHAEKLRPYAQLLKSSRDVLAKDYPYNRCEKYQQSILRDLEKTKTEGNEIIIQNIIDRTQEEFLRLSALTRKNSRQNYVSIAIGITGIVVSVILQLIMR